ncbi:ATP:cob(I)alamin adenosyltransferase [Candidatus Micrarchaeota archaeon CG11_big_fil_rev_8_21_14_0_20_47_5]|nr:MAG: ATP:cob(I)alamin adenosyltransferase [Candidatus Micrarchaeota archaeon CG1_02_47_40]PIN83703.1 MAG: ATP:cob(I)alamin adenosyltransferase [Candidatus Micrarchaeota archaeon CG11_big_fil_rev_8_21_14_0_20_47_5]
MAITTRNGDDGSTSLPGGRKVPKNHPLIEALGEIDELNSSIGFARSLCAEKETNALLKSLQSGLFSLSFSLAGQSGKAPSFLPLESQIASLEKSLPHLSNFIYPSGTPLASSLHLSRAICRRAERRLCELLEIGEAQKEHLVYLNRLSDLLFLLARKENQKEGKEEGWQG